MIIFLTTLLYSYNLVDIYRFEGKEVLSKHIEKLLANEQYWLKYLSNKDVRFGYFETNKDLLVCVKKEKVLKVFKWKKNSFKLIDSFNVLTGLNGDKKKEGDLKTPVGVYTLLSIIKNPDPFYGPFAFETSYPNLYDRIHQKDGHGIWIHGVPLKGKRDSNNTKGCIVMQNDKLKKLRNEIVYKNCFLLIAENSVLTATKKEIAQILSFIYRWRNAWKNNDFKRYKMFYDSEFMRSDGKSLKKFLEYKKRVFESKKNQKVEIFFSDINIIPYQNINNEKIFRINMLEKYLSRTYQFEGNKELYVKITDNDIKIIVEK